MQIRSLGQGDPLAKEMATHFSVLALEISGTGELGGLQSMGSQRVWLDLMTKPQRSQEEVVYRFLSVLLFPT